MANPDAAFGFRAVGRNGGAYSGVLHRVFLASTATTTDVFVGDVVQLDGSASTDGYPTVVVLTSTSAIPYGVVAGFEADPTDLGTQYAKKATVGGRYAKVVLCDEAVFEVQSDAVMALNDVGGNTEITLGGGSTVTGISGFELTGANVTTLVGDILQIQSFVDRPDNDPTLTNANLIVKFNDAATHPDRLGLAT